MRIPLIHGVVAGAFLFMGCDGDDLGPSEPGTKVDAVMGRVFDSRGLPAEGIEVATVPPSGTAVTDARGNFVLLDLPAGALRVVAQLAVPAERCLLLSPAKEADVGDFHPGMASSCGLPARCAGDQDCDGLSDRAEQEGWWVTVQGADRRVDDRSVLSDVTAWDSDLDGLDDAAERAALLDPLDRDTDGDLLSDYAELIVFHSSGTMTDTDGDACPLANGDGYCLSDPDLWDGFEVLLSRTSPTLADTDGDGIRDDQEINVGGTNPRVADLPELELRLHGNPLIEVQVNYETGTSERQQELTRNEEEQIDTDSTSTKMSIENTVTLHTETEAGTSTWPPSFSAKLTTDTKFQHGYFHDTSSNWKNTAVQESQRNYETWERQSVSFDDGKLSVAMKVQNRSDLSFALDDLRIVAFRLEGGGQFSLIGTLQPDAAWGDGDHVLGPGGELTMNATLEHIGAATMRALIRNPTAMMFEIGAYQLFQLDELGQERTVSYAKLGEAVVQRTGLVVVDFGDGRVERHLVATNVFRRPDGAGFGIPVSEALADLGLGYEQVVATSSLGVPGARVLSRVADVSAYDTCRDEETKVDCDRLHPRGYWLVAGNGEAFSTGRPVDLDTLVLGRGERIHLVYNRDQDGDGLFDREEALLGTDPARPDSDGDELSDYEEAKEGWPVAVQGRTPYVIYSDPRFADIDGDFLSDRTELSVGTDPYMKNTDGDTDNDTVDPNPLSPPCLSGEAIGLSAWWDGSYELRGGSYYALDTWSGTADGHYADDGVLESDNPAGMLNQIAGDRVLQMNQEPTDRHERVSVADHSSISPQHEFTVSAWIYWQGIGAGSDWATLLAKGTPDRENYRLMIRSSGVLRLTVLRNTHETCWYCSFGSNSLCDNSACADEEFDELLAIDANRAIPTQTWVHVAATFGGEVMRLYINGQLAAAGELSGLWWDGWFRYQRTTNRLVTNDRPLRIGLDDATTPTAPFRGLVDDVQLNLRSLRPDEVGLLYGLGVCTP